MKAQALALLTSLALAPFAQAQFEASLPELVQSGQREQALQMIAQGADVNLPQPDGTTALHWAVYRVDAELVASLLAKGATPDLSNRFGSTPLSEAVKIANLEIVEQLLEAGANPDALNQDGQSALMLAAQNGALPLAELLIEHGADVNLVEQWRGQSALMWAAAENHPELTELLLEHGADVNLRALHFDWGSQITSEPRGQYRPSGGLTPLLYAARGGCLRCVQGILAKGADIDLPDPDGVTPLLVAIDNQHYDLAAWLLEEGANPHAWDWWGRTPLYVAIDVNSLRGGRFAAGSASRNERSALDVARLLLEAGVNPNPQLNQHRPGRGGGNGRFTDDLLNSGATPLLRAANSFDVEAIQLLLEHGALVDLPNAMGVTPFLAAAGFAQARNVLGGNFPGNVEPQALAAMEVLQAAGADIQARVSDTTSKTARIARRSSMTEREGQTALHGAAARGWTEVVTWLLDHGLDINAKDKLGRTPLDAASAIGGGRTDRPIEAMVAFLQERGGEQGAQPADEDEPSA